MPRLATRKIGRHTALAVLALAAAWAMGAEAFADSVTYTYDALGRVVSESYQPSGMVIYYNYDAAGNRSLVTSCSSSGSTATWGCFSWNGANWN